MNIKTNTYFITNKASARKTPDSEKIGIRGQQAYDLVKMGMPVVPGAIINTDISSKLEKAEGLIEILNPFFDYYKKQSGKIFDSAENPMLLKIVMSSNLAIASYPTLHNFGLADNTFEGFSKYVGTDFANHEFLFMLNGIFQVEIRIAELLEDNKALDKYRKNVSKLNKVLHSEDPKVNYTKILEELKSELDPGLFTNASDQLEIVLKRISYLIQLEDTEDTGVAILVQPMVYGNYGKDSYSGYFTTRNAITGDSDIEGEFFQNKFNSAESTGKAIKNIDKKYYSEFVDIAAKLEAEYRDMRRSVLPLKADAFLL